MSRNRKIILAVVSGLIVIGACACLASILFFRNGIRSLSKAVVTNPSDLATVTAGIATFDPPAGYQQTGMNFLGAYQGVILTNSQDSRRTIMMFGVPNISAQEQQQFEQMLQQQLGQAGGEIQWETATITPVQIRSQQVDLSTSKGAGKNGESFQMEMTIFKGVKGSVILMVAGPQQGWDQATIDTFIRSIR